MEPILVESAWHDAKACGSFRAQNPGTKANLGVEFPLSSWADCDRILDAAVVAARVLRGTSGEVIAGFLEGYASRIETRADEIVRTAHNETALPVEPRLPRSGGDTSFALRQAVERQDADRRGAQSCNELRRPVPKHRTSRLHPRSAFRAPCDDFGPCNATTAFVTIARPTALQDKGPHEHMWRTVDGAWVRG